MHLTLRPACRAGLALVTLGLAVSVSAAPAPKTHAKPGQPAKVSRHQANLDDDLVAAAQAGRLAGVKAALGRGANINGPDLLGSTALIEACRMGHTEIVAYLLQNGADVRRRQNDGATALHEAVELPRLDIATLLLAHGADPNAPDNDGNTPLIDAASGAYWRVPAAPKDTPRDAAPMVDLLLAHGADIGVRDHLGENALLAALLGGDSKDAPPDATIAAQNTDVALLLIDRGADIGTPDKTGTTPLIAALSVGVPPVAALLDRGAAVDAKDPDGLTALMHAALNGNKKEVAVLIAAGADVNARSGSGDSALILAAGAGDGDSVGALLAEGADRAAKNHKGQTALSIARQVHDDDIIQQLSAPPPPLTKATDAKPTPLPPLLFTPAPDEATTPGYHLYDVRRADRTPDHPGDTSLVDIHRLESVTAHFHIDGVPEGDNDEASEIRAQLATTVVAVSPAGHTTEMRVTVKSGTGRSRPGEAMTPLSTVGAELKVVLAPAVHVTRVDGKPIPVLERLLWRLLFQPQDKDAADDPVDPDGAVPQVVHIGDTWALPLGASALDGLPPDTELRTVASGTTVMDGKTYVVLKSHLSATQKGTISNSPEVTMNAAHVERTTERTVPTDPGGHTVHLAGNLTVVVGGKMHLPGGHDTPITGTTVSSFEANVLEHTLAPVSP